MSVRVLFCLLLLALSACTFDTRGPGALVDAGLTKDRGVSLDQSALQDAIDLQSADAVSDAPFDGAGDIGRPDTLARDSADEALTPDATDDTLSPDSTVDTLSPDSTVDTAVGCAQIFGTDSTFSFCAEDATSCTYYVVLGGVGCSTFCAAHGTTCLGSYDEGPTTDLCVASSADRGCGGTSNDRLCLCQKP